MKPSISGFFHLSGMSFDGCPSTCTEQPIPGRSAQQPYLARSPMVDTNMPGWVPGIEQPSWSWKNEMLLYYMVIVDQLDQRP